MAAPKGHGATKIFQNNFNLKVNVSFLKRGPLQRCPEGSRATGFVTTNDLAPDAVPLHDRVAMISIALYCNDTDIGSPSNTNITSEQGDLYETLFCIVIYSLYYKL